MLKTCVMGAVTAVAFVLAVIGAQPVSAQSKDIVDTAVAPGSFKTLAAALTAADLRVLALTACVAATSSASQAPAPVRTVSGVDLNRYLGAWFEVARLPNRFQTDCAGDVRATYARAADGSLDVTNQCRRHNGEMMAATGVGKVVDARTSARLKVRFAPAFLAFLPMVWGDYWILGLADDYSWAVVGSPDRKYLWILARTVSMDPAEYGKAVSIAAANGFAVDALVRTAHARTPPV